MIPRTVSQEDWSMYEDISESNLGSRGSSAESAALSYEKQSKKKRAKYPKVRTGCINCKKRHVKCDETKPSCKRCIKWKGSCSGYLTEGGEPTSPSPNMETPTPDDEDWISASQGDGITLESVDYSGRHLLPKTTEPHDANSIEPSTPDSSGSTRTMHIHDTSALGTDFWTGLAPEMFQNYPAVRSASSAVHLLIHAKPLPSMAPEQGDREENQFERAFACYGQALRDCMQASMSPEGLRPAILCSLFFIIFDIIHDDMAAAKAHFDSGRKLLDEYLRMKTQDFDKSGKDLSEELKHAMQFLMDQTGSNTIADWGQIIHERASLLT